MSNLCLSRRAVLAGGAAVPLAAGMGGVAPAIAAAHGGPKNAVQNSFALGDFQVSTLLVGSRPVDDVHTIFGTNVSDEEFARVSAENFIPSDRSLFFFTPTVVRAGDETVLFDTGLSAEGTLAALGAAGIEAGDVDVVVITHMHGDHIGGMTDADGQLTYPNARYVTGQVEFDHWAGTDNETFGAKVRPFAERFSFIKGGDSVASGMTAIEAFGHTPGHMAYMLESGGKQLLLMVDTANHYVWSLAYPDWEVRFDIDKSMAADTRRKLLGMVAADRIPLVGYHMPFPGLGYVTADGPSSFRYVPVSYQLML